jgi:hypothetical protein
LLAFACLNCQLLGLTEKVAMLRPDLHPLSGGLLETPHSTSKIDKGIVVNL